MPLGRQLAVYCLDVAVITLSSLVCLTSIAVVAYESDRVIAYLMWSPDLPFPLRCLTGRTGINDLERNLNCPLAWEVWVL